MGADRERDRILDLAHILHLSTRGRSTGQPRQVELWFAYDQRNQGERGCAE
jgi:hypothetical protein